MEPLESALSVKYFFYDPFKHLAAVPDINSEETH